jgi:predicted metal-dependent peptidase
VSVATPTPAATKAKAKPVIDLANGAHIQALSKAKIQLMAREDSAFFTTVCFSLKHVWSNQIPTAATDGRQILFNPTFFMSLSVEEQVFLLIHESMHVAYLHMARLQDRNHRRWNHAADYVINQQLVDRGFKMPACGLLDAQYAGKSTEEVYDMLPDNPPGGSSQAWDDLMPGNGDPAAAEALTQEIQDILVRAQIQSKMANDRPGTIPGDIQVFLDRLLDPKLPWNRILQRWFTSFAKNDYSFKKPSRRFFPKYHMPSLHGEKLMNLGVAIDISGSVSDHDFHVIITEIHSILRMLKPEKITVVQFDTEIKHVNEVRNVKELMSLQFHGRGGTLIEPVMDWAVENKPQALLVFSDGEFNLPEVKPKNTEVLWLIHNNDRFKPPFGKTVHYTI